MIGIVGLMISCMKGQDTYIRFKEKYNKKETLHNITLLGEETSTLTVDSKEEDEEEAWVEVEVRSFVIIVHNRVIWKEIARTLVPLEATATHLNMLLRIVQHY